MLETVTTSRLVMLGVPTIGIAMLICALAARNRRPTASSPTLTFLTILLGGATVLLSVVALGAAVYEAVLISRDGDFTPKNALAIGLLLLVLPIAAWAGGACIRMGSALRQTLSLSQRALIEQRASQVQVFGWTLVCLPVLSLGLIGVFFLIVPLVFAASILLFLKNVRWAQQSHMMRLMALCIDKQLPLGDELEVQGSTLRGRMRQYAFQAADQLRSGTSISDTLWQTTGLVPQHVALAVRIAEPSGRVAEVLRESAERHSDALRQQQAATSGAWLIAYFWTVVVFCQLVLGFLLVYVVPKHESIFEMFQVDMPGPLTELVEATEAGGGVFLPMLSIPMSILLVFGLGYIWGWENVNLAVFARAFPRFDTPGLLRNLARALEGNAPLPDVLEQISIYHHRGSVRTRVERIDLAVREGGNWLEGLRTEGFINNAELALLQSAERAGNLPWALRETADSAERRQARRARIGFEFIKPIVILIICGIIGYICYAMFTPIIALESSIAPTDLEKREWSR